MDRNAEKKREDADTSDLLCRANRGLAAMTTSLAEASRSGECGLQMRRNKSFLERGMCSLAKIVSQQQTSKQRRS
ncbi:hypothetical protein TSPI_04685 [Trichinella spiralis]|uniref:Uncharacterized protein n=1 Tax=Trichinella spiralis TaxID=6334 RepID=A0ABR3KZK9_TRISP